MAVLKGEGRVPILYSSYSLPAAPHRPVYLSRPGLSGRYPSLVVLHGDSGVTPSVRDLCRRFARHGYAAAAPDLYRGATASDLSSVPAIRAAADGSQVVDAMHGAWSGFASPTSTAVVGLDGAAAIAVAVARVAGGPLALLGGPFHGLASELGRVAGPILGVVAGVDDATSAAIRALHQRTGRGEWVVYPSVGPGFFDDGSEEYHRSSAADAFDRLIAFLDRHLAPVPT